MNFELLSGEVHGLVGANGAGKSTFIRMLSGASRPTPAKSRCRGHRSVRGSPAAARHRHRRHLPGTDHHSGDVGSFQCLSRQGSAPLRSSPTSGGWSAAFAELSRWMGVNISPHANAGTLSVANQQMIEILRAVQTEQNVLIMDEPTAPLGPFERARLYDLIGRLKENGVAIIFISHDLDEVLKLCDRVSVMREGQLVETRNARNGPRTRWFRRCSATSRSSRAEAKPRDGRGTVARQRNLTLPGELFGLSFGLHQGEILGIAGLVGAGTHRGVALYRRGRALAQRDRCDLPAWIARGHAPFGSDRAGHRARAGRPQAPGSGALPLVALEPHACRSSRRGAGTGH